MYDASWKERIFGRVCEDCGGRYWNWYNHAFGKRHLKFVRKWAAEHNQLEEFEKWAGKGYEQ